MKSFLILFICLTGIFLNGFSQNYSEDDQKEIDSLNALIENPSSHDTTVSESYIALTEIMYVKNLDTMIPLCKKAIEIIHIALNKNPNPAVKKKLTSNHAAASNNIGYVFEEKGMVDSAIYYYDESIKYAREAGDQNVEAYVYNNMAGIYKDQGNFALALENYHKSLKLMEQTNDQKGRAMSLNNIGLIYREQGDFEKAINYYEQSLEIKKIEQDQKGIANTLHNIASVYSLKGDTSQAIQINRESLAIRRQLGDKKGIALSLSNLGDLFYHGGQLDSAFIYYQEAYDLRSEIGNKEGIVSSSVNLGWVYYEKGKFSQAQKYALEAYKFAEELSFPNLIERSAGLLRRIYYSLGKYKQAYDLFLRETEMKKILSDEENFKKLQKEQARYEYEMKHTADSVAYAKQKQIDQIEIAKQDAELKAKRNQQYAMIAGIALLFLFALFLYNRFRITRNQKRIIEQQKVEVVAQKEIIETKHKEITDSINYAKRIQAAILPSQNLIDEFLPNSFVLYKPKDIVAGDFYWLQPLGSDSNMTLALAAADCTGHGVPGAMVSVVCNNALNRSVREYGLTDPGKILDKTREIVISEFEKSNEEVKDGMDVSLVVMQRESEDGKLLISWAGANNPLWIARKGATQMEEIKGDKQPVGKYAGQKPFVTHQIKLNTGDTIYIFTDGYQDQFGGDKGKKFKASTLKEFLLSNTHLPLNEQHEKLNHAFESWKGELEQVDDVCIIGVRV